MEDIEIQFKVNGIQRTVSTAPSRTLLKVLRDDLGLTGTKDGCSQGDCGACVVVMDDQAVNSCLVLAAQVEGKEVLTIEGLSVNGQLSHLQQAFAEKWGLQCGFCTPGILMSSYALLRRNPEPSNEQIRRALAGNLCRCTGYTPIVNSVQHAVTQGQEVHNGK
jgi:carbon-monoxide dehydrogenase small subunit